MSEWTPKMTCVMIVAIGLDSCGFIDPASYSADDQDTPCTAENVGGFGYMEEDLITDHLVDRAAAFRMLRYAQTKGFIKMRELWLSMYAPHKGVNHAFVAMTEELFAVCSPEVLEAFGGEMLTIPKADSLHRQLKHRRVIELLDGGATYNRAASLTGYSRRHAINIGKQSGGTTTERQFDLFGAGKWHEAHGTSK